MVNSNCYIFYNLYSDHCNRLASTSCLDCFGSSCCYRLEVLFFLMSILAHFSPNDLFLNFQKYSLCSLFLLHLTSCSFPWSNELLTDFYTHYSTCSHICFLQNFSKSFPFQNKFHTGSNPQSRQILLSPFFRQWQSKQ